MDKQDEIELVRRLLSGDADADAFDRFVEHFRTRIFQYTWLMCGQREDAEEVSQETLLKVFESFHTLREPEHVRAWVFRIARNACLMKRRHSLFAPPHELPLDDIDIEGTSELPDDEMLRAELRQHLDSAIAELPQSYRAVILLRDVEELTTQQTADILAVSTDVVKQRLHRGRLALKQKLAGYVSINKVNA